MKIIVLQYRKHKSAKKAERRKRIEARIAKYEKELVKLEKEIVELEEVRKCQK